MSEPIGMEITIGGNLPADLIEEFLDALQEINDSAPRSPPCISPRSVRQY
jgi:hypothetical protein